MTIRKLIKDVGRHAIKSLLTPSRPSPGRPMASSAHSPSAWHAPARPNPARPPSYNGLAPRQSFDKLMRPGAGPFGQHARPLHTTAIHNNTGTATPPPAYTPAIPVHELSAAFNQPSAQPSVLQSLHDLRQHATSFGPLPSGPPPPYQDPVPFGTFPARPVSAPTLPMNTPNRNGFIPMPARDLPGGPPDLPHPFPNAAEAHLRVPLWSLPPGLRPKFQDPLTGKVFTFNANGTVHRFSQTGSDPNAPEFKGYQPPRPMTAPAALSTKPAYIPMPAQDLPGGPPDVPHPFPNAREAHLRVPVWSLSPGLRPRFQDPVTGKVFTFNANGTVHRFSQTGSDPNAPQFNGYRPPRPVSAPAKPPTKPSYISMPAQDLPGGPPNVPHPFPNARERHLQVPVWSLAPGLRPRFQDPVTGKVFTFNADGSVHRFGMG